MPRRLRAATGGIVYHVLNRAVGRMTLFEKQADYLAFERTLADVHRRMPCRILSYCFMPNHWHFVLWPRRDGELSEFLRLLTVTHTQRWHASHGTAGTGPLYQGRFKSFPAQQDEHLLTLCRYTEQNAMRARLARTPAQWRWCSAWQRAQPEPADWLLAMSAWPIDLPSNWTELVNRPLAEKKVETVRQAAVRGRPLGNERWITQTAARLGLQSTMRPRGRPRKEDEKK